MGTDVASAVTRGAIARLTQEGVRLVGGHTIASPWPIFGLAVTGMLTNPPMLMRNAEPGDRLVLTKPIGVGIVVAANKSGLASEEDVRRAETLMNTSNRPASSAAVRAGVSACTDVAGYGLIGHLHGMMRASSCSAVIDLATVPVLPDAFRIAEELGLVPNSAERTYFALEASVQWSNIRMESRFILCDPQTSGGLLFAIHPRTLDAFVDEARGLGVSAEIIGEVRPATEHSIVVAG